MIIKKEKQKEQTSSWYILVFNFLRQIMFNDQERRTILQQIVDLKRFQLNGENDHSTKINGLHVDEKLNQQAQKSQDSAINLLAEDNPIEEVNLETFSSVFSQLDNLSSSSAMDLPLNGELFWTYKSSLQNNQVRYLLSTLDIQIIFMLMS